MGILKRIAAHFSPPELTAPAPTAENVQRQKTEIFSAVARLLSVPDADLHSPVRGDCLHFAAKLRATLQQENLDLRLVSVFAQGMPMPHYHLRSPTEVITDPTWKQWLTGNIPADLPPVFVGTREDLIALVSPFASSLPKRNVILEQGPSLSPTEFVDLYYGFGSHAGSVEDVTFQLSNAHRDPRSRVSKPPL